MKKSFVIHPFLFAIYPILFIFSHNIEQVYYIQILLPLTIVLGSTLLLLLLARLISNNYIKVAIIISVSIILFFSYGHIYELIVDQYFWSFEIGRHRYLLLTWGLLLTCSIYLIVRTHKDLLNFTSALNIAAFSLVIISVFNIGVYEIKAKNTSQDISKSMENLETTTSDLENASEFRDIYYIILDGYASSSTLKDVYGYDNQSFTDYLIKKGFYVAAKSKSNYPMTFSSLASSLNMKYVNYLSDVVGIESKDPTLPYKMITNNKVMNFLKLKGYKFIHFSSGWGPTDRNRYADIEFHGGKGNEFLMALVQTTVLKTIEKFIITNDIRKTTLNAFSKLPELHRIKEPKFVFAHIISPHPPYLFDVSGEPVPGAGLTMDWKYWKQKKNYLNQLIFINKKVEKLIDDLLLNSEISPIIIFQADHGPGSTFPDGMYFPMTANENMLRERMTILNAYYLPSDGNDLLYDSITPVNTFRLIFDFYFATNNGLLDDRCYFSTYGRPYDFIDVTDSLKYH